MCADNAFLRRNWTRIRKSIEYMMGCDANKDGLLEGEQYNTLDAAWYGEMAWISSLYIAALRAGEAMATEMRDQEFAGVDLRSVISVESRDRSLVDEVNEYLSATRH